MSSKVCSSCGTLVPGESCPHCGAHHGASRSRVPMVAAASAAVLLGLTFSACSDDGEVVALYGAPVTDMDNDGYDSPEDCDDNDASVYPGAEETAGDGVDSDCDGEDDPQS